MGLDSYLIEPEGVEIEWPKVNLCGGMMSGNGSDGSFRGKVYEGFINAVTGQSLYREEGGNEWLRRLANKLADYANGDDRSAAEEFDISEREVNDLATLFVFAAENGCTYHGWW